MVVTSPASYQVIQRNGSSQANITITGNLFAPPADIEAQWNGGSWTTIATAASGVFSGTLSNQSAGQGTLNVRIKNTPASTVSLPYVGIGEVFLVAGQSNGAGEGTNHQTYSGSFKACMFLNGAWQELKDPTAGSAYGGSVWPLVATSLMSDLNVPVAFINYCQGETSSADWQPGQADYTAVSSVVAAQCPAGARCILWWQGEDDAAAGVSQATYYTNLGNIANGAWSSTYGLKLMPCKLQTMTGSYGTGEVAINLAIAQAWLAGGNALTGPDLTGVIADNTPHITTDANLATAAALWWAAIKAAYGW